ncbi:MAG: tetratricopeptide repeat protein [Vulcanimicrobiaceae bacterium]
MIVILTVALGVVQLGSDALYHDAAVPWSFPARVPISVGVAIDRTIARVAPAPYVETSLARTALQQGDLRSARRYADALPDSPIRNELLARIARAAGHPQRALRYDLAAPDIDAVRAIVRASAAHHPQAAARVERRLLRRLRTLGTHPNAVGEAYWELGRLDTQRSWYAPSQTAIRRLRARAVLRYHSAVTLAPYSEKYLLALAFGQFHLGDLPAARVTFMRDLGVDPASADAYAGLGMVALAQGDRVAAVRYLQQARTRAPRAPAVLSLERKLQ